jgi:hypothetical protein
MFPGAEETGTERVPRAEETRVGEMEDPWIAQYVNLSTKITTEEARCVRT